MNLKINLDLIKRHLVFQIENGEYITGITV